MEKTTEFFSANHKRLLDLATWAKYLAWVALVVGILGMGTSALQSWNLFQTSMAWNTTLQPTNNFMQVLRTNPSFALSLLIGMARVLFGGVFYFVVLRGISLGLNMIVETHINYRDKNSQGGAQ
ncbi:MAG: hypothetical protein HY869_18260 [Chloroflexi bacterium]|nr:hypothetical protein [Chloroflexota bacterium]